MSKEEKDEGGKVWSKSLVRKKVRITRARAPIWWVRVQGVWEGVNLLLLVLLLFIPAIFVVQSTLRTETAST